MKKYSSINPTIYSVLMIIYILACGVESTVSSQSSPSTAIDAKIIDIKSDYGIDIDNDHLFEFLTLDVEIIVSVPGEYSLMGFLYSQHNQKLAWSIDHRNLSIGTHVMHLDFCGSKIKEYSINGTYLINSLSLLANSSDRDLVLCDELIKPYITSNYNYTDFSDYSN